MLNLILQLKYDKFCWKIAFYCERKHTQVDSSPVVGVACVSSWYFDGSQEHYCMPKMGKQRDSKFKSNLEMEFQVAATLFFNMAPILKAT